MSERGKEFIERARNEVIPGDGGMGTRLYALGVPLEACYDELNLVDPGLVEKVHRDYLDAGARLIETNTFGANPHSLAQFGLEEKTREINLAGARIAKEAAGDDAWVVGSVGPLGLKTEERDRVGDLKSLYIEPIEALAEGGVDLLFLETFYDMEEMEAAFRAAREVCDLPVGTLFTFLESGRTTHGVEAVDALERMEELGTDLFGTNCGKGPREVRAILEKLGPEANVPLAAFPNAGFPEYRDGRYVYLATPGYMAEMAKKFVSLGSTVIGGCCGTTPTMVRAIRDAIEPLTPHRPRRTPSGRLKAAPKVEGPPGGGTAPYLRERGVVPPIVVEIDPPKKLKLGRTLKAARKLKSLGIDAMTMGDCPLAILRMNGLMAAQIVEREVGIPVICHLACRDRNLIGLQGTIMGAHAMGLRHLLPLTGDPAKIGNQPGATSVYDMNSFGLIELISGFNRGVNILGEEMDEQTDFTIGVAFNPNGPRIGGHVRRLEKKVELGAHYALTQPVYDVERIQEFYEATEHLDIPIFLGVFPLLSYRNAEFIHNEVPGIDIPDDIRKRFKGLPKEDARRVGYEIVEEIIEEVADTVPGWYVITPFNNVKYSVPVVEMIQTKAKRELQAK